MRLRHDVAVGDVAVVRKPIGSKRQQEVESAFPSCRVLSQS